MSELKCPFCQQELRNCCAGVIYTCSKPDSCPHEQCYGSKELWLELIRTRKALDIAIDALNKYTSASGNWWYGYEFQGDYENCAGEYANRALEQITALEQKGE